MRVVTVPFEPSGGRGTGYLRLNADHIVTWMAQPYDATHCMLLTTTGVTYDIAMPIAELDQAILGRQLDGI